MFGFMKNEKSNITSEELEWLVRVARRLLSLNELELSVAIEVGEIDEIKQASS
jgi:hypothetical protein